MDCRQPAAQTRRALLRTGVAFGAIAAVLPNRAWSGSPSPGLVIPVEGGELQLTPLSDRAVRVRFKPDAAVAPLAMPEILDARPNAKPPRIARTPTRITFTLPAITCVFDKQTETLSFQDAAGRVLLTETPDGRSAHAAAVRGHQTMDVAQSFESPPDERLYGTGCFQDGALDLRGLPRRLTQVNTQISLPFLLSSKGYGLLWHNTGLSELNPPPARVKLDKVESTAEAKEVDVTTSTGGAKMTRRDAAFEGRFSVGETGLHALLLDVGRPMASRYHVEIDGKVVCDFANLWLPPTTSLQLRLAAGEHRVRVIGASQDAPVLHFGPVKPTTVWRSPVADAIDYVVIAGPSADAVMAGYRELSGAAPLFPRWAYGYIHCRERFTSSAEILENAREFRARKIPVDVMVQDWQYWGKHGWNAMRFDETAYPDPAGLVRDLHAIDMRLMLSVWSKVDRASELGREIAARGDYIPGTEWVDFFNPRAAAFYAKRQNEKLTSLGIDAWWQDATEPENDDLRDRDTAAGPGERVRLTYPLQVSRTVYQAQRNARPGSRVMILTRSAFPGQQQFAAATWSGDIGNDWETLKRQIPAGLNMAAAGYPYWTVDAGGFFRPGDGQYADPAYHERFLRWLQCATFLPLQRVHGYQTKTEIWRYGADVERIGRRYIELRYRLMPYIYSMAADTTRTGTPLIRPLVFDFPQDGKALDQGHSYMFGRALHVSPVVEPGVSQWPVYLPEHPGGWYDFWTGQQRQGGRDHLVAAPLDRIPVHVRAGAILPMGPVTQSTAESIRNRIELHVYAGADGETTLYEDAGLDYAYERGEFAQLQCRWRDADRTLEIKRSGRPRATYASDRLEVVLHGPGAGPVRRVHVALEADLTRVVVS
jgi:alpha-D-xyloside xylohydrolase